MVLLLAAAALCFATGSLFILKFYPIIINLVFLFAFGITLFFPPTMIFVFATLQDKTIKGSLGEKSVQAYCRKVTIVWCGLFIVNGSIATLTIFLNSNLLWAICNTGIPNVLMGALFLGEFIVRKRVQRGTPQVIGLSAFKSKSRLNSKVVCFEGTYSEGRFKTWIDFLNETAKLRVFINKIDSKRCMLYCENYWYFLIAFTSLLQCKKEILLGSNIKPDYIKEIRGDAPLFTDHIITEEMKNTYSIVSLLDTESSKNTLKEPAPIINPNETSIVMYTSGSTGKPKEVSQRLTEFENDNKFIISKWGDELIKRNLCSTVSQQHIYGLLYSVLLPFTAGIPFRRSRIEFPEELEKLTDSEYTLITVPAFLKRAVEIENNKSLNLKSPWIFTSGGVLDLQTAEKTNNIFGFWPMEVYGSTETSGIAWRQSKNGLEWTSFDNAKISKNSDDCLVIRSPYIKDENGFETADMVEILEDGRFILKGRIDSIVKIEEKRISLIEVENCVLKSGLASDACVISIEGKRQYLAAAIVFNEKGKNEFNSAEKQKINKYWKDYLSKYFEGVVVPRKWRYLDKLPLDAQGKKKKEEIKELFRGINE